MGLDASVPGFLKVLEAGHSSTVADGIDMLA